MGKDSEKLDEILDSVKSIQSQINFLQVQMGSGSKGAVNSRADTGKSSGTASIDSKQLLNIDRKFDELSNQMSQSAENLNNVNEQLSKLTQSKVEQADERMNQVTRLLEKGLQLTEMGSQLTEIKDRLEEVLVELATASKSSEVLKGISDGDNE